MKIFHIKEELNSLNEMALETGKVIGRVDGKADTITGHILKCILYNSDSILVDGWVEEIASNLYEINQLECKTRSKKLKEITYQRLLRSEIGENTQDAYAYVLQFYNLNKSRGCKYLDFEPTVDISEKLLNACNDLFNEICPKFTIKDNGLTKQDLNLIVTKIINKYTKK